MYGCLHLESDTYSTKVKYKPRVDIVPLSMSTKGSVVSIVKEIPYKVLSTFIKRRLHWKLLWFVESSQQICGLSASQWLVNISDLINTKRLNRVENYFSVNCLFLMNFLENMLTNLLWMSSRNARNTWIRLAGNLEVLARCLFKIEN